MYVSTELLLYTTISLLELSILNWESQKILPIQQGESKLKNNNIKQQFKLELRNRFQILVNEQESQTEEVDSVEGKWNNFKLAFQKTSENDLGIKKN